MADEELTLFDLPNSPEQLGVNLAPAKLRNIDFSALDFTTARRATIEYMRTYFPTIFNDFVASNGAMMYAEITCSHAAKLSLRMDLLSGESFFPTCKTEESAINHLALINQKIKPQTPAVADVEISISTPITTDLAIPAGTRFKLRGPDAQPLYYEVFRAPGDFTGDIVIPAGKRGIIAYGIEGRFTSPKQFISPGGSDQTLTITDTNILEQPVAVKLYTGTVTQDWVATMDPLERFGSNDRVVNYKIYSDRIEFKFGNDINGKAPLAGQQIKVSYRVGGGIRGRIGSNAINETRPISPLPPATAGVEVLFRNPAPSSGGTDRETLDQVKRRAPRDFATWAFAADRPASIVTDGDYAHVAGTFSHPVFGAVAKAVASVRTGKNANLVELYVLSYGPSGLVTPSAGLKRALETYITQYNVTTDEVRVLDGSIKPIDVDMTVVVNRNADATFVESKVNQTLDSFFSVDNRELGEPLYTADIVNAVMSIDGVRYVDLFTPTDNVLQTNQAAGVDPDGVGFDEIIVEGKRSVKIFYEKGVAR